MGSRMRKVLDQALKLTPKNRWEVTEALQLSLPPFNEDPGRAKGVARWRKRLKQRGRAALDLALALSPAEREALTNELLVSIGEQPLEDLAVVDAAWSKEIARRLKDADDPSAKWYSQEEALQILRADLEKRRR